MNKLDAATCSLFVLSKLSGVREEVLAEGKHPDCNDMADVNEISCSCSAWYDVEGVWTEVPVKARVFAYEPPVVQGATIPQWRVVVEAAGECVVEGVGNLPREAIDIATVRALDLRKKSAPSAFSWETLRDKL